MKMIKWVMMAVLMTSLFLWAGCGKGGNSGKAGKTVDINGVQVALPELQQSLMTSKDPNVLGSAGKLAYGVRYGNYPAVQDELNKLAADPNLTADQKKLVATVQDQMKQALAKQPGQ